MVLTLDPVEMLRKARDTQRMTDLANFHTSIGLLQAEVTFPDIGSSTCSASAVCSTTAGTLAIDGTGWAAINYSAMASPAISVLPRDPTNSGTYVYYYAASGTDYEIDAILESTAYSGNMANAVDGGDDAAYYEVGTDLTII